jgi:hypothetical protein
MDHMENREFTMLDAHAVVQAALTEFPDAATDGPVTTLPMGRIERVGGAYAVATLDLAEGVRFGWNGVAAWIDMPGHMPGAVEISMVGRPASDVIDHPWLITSGTRIRRTERRDDRTRLHLDD